MVGLPRESIISLALTDLIFAIEPPQ